MSRELPTYLAAESTPEISAVELLRGAIDHLSGGSKRWAKGDFHVDGGSCALGAIELAGYGKAARTSVFIEIQVYLLKTLKDMHPELQANTIPDLNDDPAVTYEDILAAFEKTALHFEERV